MNARIPGLPCLILLLLAVAGSLPAQSRPTPTPKEKIIHPSAVQMPTPVRAEPEVLTLNLDKITLPDAVELLERLTGEKHTLATLRPPVEGGLSISRLQGPKLIVVQQLRQAIAFQAGVQFTRSGDGWAVTERGVVLDDPNAKVRETTKAPDAVNAPRPRPRALLGNNPATPASPAPTPTPLPAGQR